jgi:hypothetical protein
VKNKKFEDPVAKTASTQRVNGSKATGANLATGKGNKLQAQAP